jgi:GntR family transcriptional repressor for pyruvate dehydrogenase complex
VAVTDDAVIKIRELIISGELRPGDQLPQESALADQLGISRNSMREAVRVLEQMRVLNVRHGSGTYVSSLEPSLLLEGISFAVEMMRDQTLREVIEVRQLLEPAATRLATQRMTPAKLVSIREAYESHRLQTSIEDLVHCDLEFHSAIISAADNDTLYTILNGLSTKTVRLRIWGGIVSENAVELTIDHHLQILKAIEQGDSHLAEAAALVHVTHARGWLDAYLNSQQDASARDA